MTTAAPTRWLHRLAGLALLAALTGCGPAMAAGLDRIASHQSNHPPAGAPADGSQPAARSAHLSWDPPATRTDGTPLVDLAGYRVYRGTTPRRYDTVVEILDPLMTEHTFEDHDPSVTYYYAVTAFDSKGMESGYSNEASKSF